MYIYRNECVFVYINVCICTMYRKKRVYVFFFISCLLFTSVTVGCIVLCRVGIIFYLEINIHSIKNKLLRKTTLYHQTVLLPPLSQLLNLSSLTPKASPPTFSLPTPHLEVGELIGVVRIGEVNEERGNAVSLVVL